MSMTAGCKSGAVGLHPKEKEDLLTYFTGSIKQQDKILEEDTINISG